MTLPILLFSVCLCGETPERANDFFWENDRVGFRAYGPGDVHKWSGETEPEALLRFRGQLNGRVTELERIGWSNVRRAETGRAWRGVAWRNERVHMPFVVWGDAKGDLRAEVTALTGPGDAKIPATVSWVGEVLVDDRPHAAPVDAAKYPPYLSGDVLETSQPFRLTEAGYRAIWASVKTPADAAPGLYRGNLKVTDGQSRVDFTIELEVLALALPKTKRFHLDIWQTPWTIARYYGVTPFSPEHYAKMEPFLRELADAGQKAITTTITDYPWNVRENIDSARSMVRYVRRRDGTFAADFKIVDEYVAFAEKCGIGPQIHCYAPVKFERSNTYQYFDEATGEEKNVKLLPATPEYEAYWGPLLSQLEAHAREKGWGDRLYIALDELPGGETAATAALIAKYAPSARFHMSGNRVPDSFKGIKIDGYSQQLGSGFMSDAFLAGLEKRRAEGRFTTLYTCCVPFRPNALPMSPLYEQRWLGLYIAAKGFDGYLKSTFFRWVKNADPLKDAHCYPNFPCGDSFLVYPGPRLSLRWQSLVDGIEDWEKIRILRERKLSTPALESALAAVDMKNFSPAAAEPPGKIVARALQALDEASVALPEAAAERGGVAFDFRAISEKRFAGVFDAARNLAKENRSGRLTATKRFEFTLPTTNGGVYRVSCRYKLAHTKTGRAAFGVAPGGYFSYVIPESANAWSVLSERAKVPRGKDKVTVTFTLNGGGVTFDYKDLTILDETPTAPLETTWTQSDNLDGTYAVAEGQACEMEVYWRKTVKTNLFCGDFRARLELPAGIAFVGAAFADTNTVRTVVNPDGSSVTTFAVSGASRSPLDAYVGYGGLSLVVKATRGPGEAGVGRLTFDYVGKAVPKFSHALKPVSFFVIPRIRAAATPVTYANGVMPSGPLEGLRDAAEEEVASFMGECGVTWLVGRAREKTYADWRKAGISRLTPGIWPCVDGFNVRGHKPVPESDRFVALDPSTGNPTQVTPGSVCPVTVYEQSEYFRTVTVPFIRDYVKGTDGAWANWEPGSYKGKGCFCDRCCRKFADYVKERYETVRADWPKCVMKGGKWFDRVEKFRSLEHAKVVHTVDGIVREATGGEKSFGFIPAIAWIEMSSWWRPRNYAAEVQAIDYADKLRWMCPWGPYAAWETDYPYVYQKRKPLCQFLAAKDIRATVNADYPAGSRPKLMGLPQGRQCSHWMTQPESIGLALDSYFFNAWESTVVYFFPQGYDARYWERFADATARAAKYESYVLKGRRADDAVTATPSGAYAKNAKFPSAYLPKEKDVPMLQTVAWERDGRRIVAVFNFWEKGEAFFDLKVGGLKGDVAVVDEKGVLRSADRSQPLWSAETLAAKGVRLVVPAARCRVFEFRSDGNWQDATAVQTDEALRSLYESRREELEKAAREDAATEDANGPIDVDYMPVI